MNSSLVEILSKLQVYAELNGETDRARALLKVVRNIKKLNHNITVKDKIDGVGQSIGNIIREYLDTGKISLLEEYENNKKLMTIVELVKILGVGPATAHTWVDNGVENIRDLYDKINEGKITLNRIQSLGLRYHNDLIERIPRAEVKQIGETILTALSKISKGITGEIAGSYRRGSLDCGDIDIIVLAPVTAMKKITEVISNDKNYVSTIVSGESRYSFLWRGNRVRQIDILLTNRDTYAFSLLYFTGSWDFNEAMRHWAKVRGCRLNQISLTCGDDKYTARTEKKIFEHLRLKYIEPRDRIGWTSIQPAT